MAYYTALISTWGTLSGTTASKLAQINALTVAGDPQPAIIPVNKIVNAIAPADLLALTTNQLLTLQLILFGNTSVDGSPGTTVRLVFQQIFTGKTVTLAALGALVAPFDTPQIPWWSAPISKGGGGLVAMVQPSDLTSAGLS